MVLNIFPRRERPVVELAAEPERTLPEPSPEALDDAARKTTRRGSRGGRGRRKPADGVVDSEIEITAGDPDVEAPAPAVRRTRTPRAPRVAPLATEATELAADIDSAAPAEPEPAPRRTSGRKPSGTATAASTPDLSALVRAVEAQGKQLEQLIRAQEEMGRRGGSGGTTATGAPPARVGVFVDSANVELAIDRLRTRVDWKKVLNMLTDGRNLVRAIAYSPVHDDPGVSLETQRFAEPFLGKGYKVVTKPLKRFADGTIKANVDIEMALDIVEMLDRVDIVCLVSGDGDFQRLVEVVQAKGVRVEVVAVGTSTSSALRNAADHYIDLQQILPKIKM
jgi:uncharacterized LabA/DUF88 family protein